MKFCPTLGEPLKVLCFEMHGFAVSLSFTLDTSSGPFSFQLGLVRTDELLIHEEVLRENINLIEESIQRTKIQYDPIIVDEKTSVVLDGMHRTEVARLLKLKFVLAMKVNYSDSRIQLGTWTRVIQGKLEFALNLAEVEFGPPRQGESSSLLTVSGMQGSKTFNLQGRDTLEKYLQLNRFIEKLQSNSVGKFRETKYEAHPSLDDEHVALIPPVITKAEVIETAKARRVFPPKSTRHVFPVRVFFASLPRRLLETGPLSDDESERAVLAYLRTKGTVIVKGKRTFGGRYYEEEELLFLI